MLIEQYLYHKFNTCYRCTNKYDLELTCHFPPCIAVVLSPRKYASADQIHALFTIAPPRPQSAYSKNRSQGTRSTPSEKGRQFITLYNKLIVMCLDHRFERVMELKYSTYPLLFMCRTLEMSRNEHGRYQPPYNSYMCYIYKNVPTVSMNNNKYPGSYYVNQCMFAGSQRHSLISSVTTVSSSRDELMEAFENLNRNPPPPPVVYETEADSLSQPTDSSSMYLNDKFSSFNMHGVLFNDELNVNRHRSESISIV